MDAFVTKLNAAGSGLSFSTYLGGSSADLGFGIARDAASGDIFVTGDEYSSDFPLVNPYQSFNDGNYDNFINRIADDATAANLSVTGSDSPDPAPAGGVLTYSLTIHNAGPDAASDVRLIDSLPAGGGVSLDHTANSQGSCLLENSTAVSCSLGGLASGVTATMTVIVDVGAATSGVISNTASVGADQADPAGANNSATQSTTISALSDPAILTQPMSQTIATGHAVTLSVVATNTLPLFYQRYQGDSGDYSNPLTSTAPNFTSPPLTATTPYWVQVSTAYRSTNSDTALITVETPPSSVTQPLSQSVSAGQAVTLSVAATGTLPLHYQWYQGFSGDTGTPVGVDSASYHTSPLTSTTHYWVRVSNDVDHVDSRTAAIDVTSRIYLPLVRR